MYGRGDHLSGTDGKCRLEIVGGRWIKRHIIFMDPRIWMALSVSTPTLAYLAFADSYLSFVVIVDSSFK